MTDTMHVWPIEPFEENNELVVSAMIENDGSKPFQLWFKIPAEHKNELTRSCDPFVIALIFHGMKNANTMIVHGQVSPSLLQNLEEFQAIWVNWDPVKYKKIEIKAMEEKEADDLTDSNKAIMAFSGGLDSCFTAFQHKKDFCGRLKRNITSAILIHGFDIPLSDKEVFNQCLEKGKIILKDLNIELIPMATNFRDLKDYWSHAHAGGLAASLSLFQKGYESGIIAASFSYSSLDLNIGWGSNPVSDLFLSSKNFKIINDGSRYERIDKLKYLNDNWPQVLDNLRVCWSGTQLDRNCCKCEKCIRNIICLYALGKKLPKSFEFDITGKQIENVIIPDHAVLFEYKCALAEAKKRGNREPWVKSLERSIRLNTQRLDGKKFIWKQIKSKIAIRTRMRSFYNNYLAGKNLENYEGAIK
ncbi:MAG: hypothetical protein ABFD79_07265 [Phycisphaerales bacterium]